MSHKVLVIDDDLALLELLRMQLEREGFSVITATNGQEGVRCLQELHPDVVLLDIMMPRVDGYTACHQIKKYEATRTIPVVMLTGVGHDLNKKLSWEIGAEGYINKPFVLQDLIGVISPLLSAY